MMKKPTILIIKMGSTYRELISASGNFDRWIVEAAMDIPVKWKSLKIDHVVPHEIEKYQGVILTGAHDSLTQPFQFMKGTERILDRILDLRIFTLGICFGHHLINLLLGGEVIRNPLGPEIGVSKISLTLPGLANPLFKGLNHARLEVYESHFDIVSSPAKKVDSLAWNEQAEFQACCYDGFIYTTQFHPEYHKKIMAYYIRKNYEILKTEHYKNPLNIRTPEEIFKHNKQIRSSAGILKNFLDLILQANNRRQ